MGKMLLLFFGSLLLFLLVMPGNHTEAEDAFEYSRLVEDGRGAELFHPHHLLYLPAQKMVYSTTSALGYGGRSYGVVRAASMFSGSLALCFFYLIACRISNGRKWIPGIGTAGLLFSYGFIRYACEVEIYLPAMALMLAAVYAALRARESRGWFAAGILCAVLAVLMHTINSAAALVVIPVIYLLDSNSWKRAFIHGGASLALIGLVYLLVLKTTGIFHPPVDAASEGWLQAGTPAKALVGLGQCLLSANFLFAYDTVAEKLQALFPYRVFVEELFTASQMPRWFKWVAPLTFVSALGALVGMTGHLLVSVVRRRAFSRSIIWPLLWLGGAVFPTIMLEPSNPELWILALAPLWALLIWFASVLPVSLLRLRGLTLLVGLLAVHNLVAGMGMVKDKAGDYNFRKAEWILSQAAAGDTVHTADSFVFTFYLNYRGNFEVRNVNTQDWKAGEATYVFDDVFHPPAAVGVRYPAFAEKVAATALELWPLCIKVHDDAFGGIYRFQTESEF